MTHEGGQHGPVLPLSPDQGRHEHGQRLGGLRHEQHPLHLVQRHLQDVQRPQTQVDERGHLRKLWGGGGWCQLEESGQEIYWENWF